MTVSHFVLRDPLVVVEPSLDSRGSYFDDMREGNLDPLVCIVCLSRPGARFTSATRSVEPCVSWSMVSVPLEK